MVETFLSPLKIFDVEKFNTKKNTTKRIAKVTVWGQFLK